MGFFKAVSKVSLVTSSSFAAILILCQLRIIFQPNVADIVLLILLIFFAVRLSKTKKFMPMGLMLVFTFVALVLRHVNI